VEQAVRAISTLAGLLRHEVDRATAHSGLSQPMAIALGRLAKLPGQATVGALARSLGCNMGNLSGTLDRLQEAGCIERVVGEADRRARFIHITAKGRKIATQISANFQRGHLWSKLEQMSVKQLELLTEAVERLNGAVSGQYQGVDQPNLTPRTKDLI
jgi:MarR family transcriptional regulator, transcriptional regulator for hemolysin